MTYSTVTYEVDSDGIGVITFNTPKMLNSISEKRLDELEAILADAAKDENLRALIVTGTGKAFCVGLDLGLLDRAFDDIPYFQSIATRVGGIASKLEALMIPTVAAINGYARAGGFEMSLGCDFIIVANEAHYGDAHTDSGVLPAASTARLTRRVGVQKAKDMIWTARYLVGQEAVDYGIALKSVPLADLVSESKAYLRTIIDKPRACIGTSKAVFYDCRDLDIPSGVAAELKHFVRYMKEEPYGKEGYRSFREGRTPSWKKTS